jgi:hypothetical protein
MSKDAAAAGQLIFSLSLAGPQKEITKRAMSRNIAHFPI